MEEKKIVENEINPILITYVGDGKFNVRLDDGRILEAGKNLRGMIKYTYFENTDEYPEIGWSVTQNKLDLDYFPKIHKDIQSGKIKSTQNK